MEKINSCRDGLEPATLRSIAHDFGTASSPRYGKIVDKSSQVYFITHHQQMYTKLILQIFCKTHMPYASAIPSQDLHDTLTIV